MEQQFLSYKETIILYSSIGYSFVLSCLVINVMADFQLLRRSHSHQVIDANKRQQYERFESALNSLKANIPKKDSDNFDDIFRGLFVSAELVQNNPLYFLQELVQLFDVVNYVEISTKRKELHCLQLLRASIFLRTLYGERRKSQFAVLSTSQVTMLEESLKNGRELLSGAAKDNFSVCCIDVVSEVVRSLKFREFDKYVKVATTLLSFVTSDIRDIVNLDTWKDLFKSIHDCKSTDWMDKCLLLFLIPSAYILDNSPLLSGIISELRSYKLSYWTGPTQDWHSICFMLMVVGKTITSPVIPGACVTSEDVRLKLLEVVYEFADYSSMLESNSWRVKQCVGRILTDGCANPVPGMDRLKGRFGVLKTEWERKDSKEGGSRAYEAGSDVDASLSHLLLNHYGAPVPMATSLRIQTEHTSLSSSSSASPLAALEEKLGRIGRAAPVVKSVYVALKGSDLPDSAVPTDSGKAILGFIDTPYGASNFKFVMVLLGPSGAGKSTVMKSIGRQLSERLPQSGSVWPKLSDLPTVGGKRRPVEAAACKKHTRESSNSPEDADLVYENATAGSGLITIPIYVSLPDTRCKIENLVPEVLKSKNISDADLETLHCKYGGQVVLLLDGYDELRLQTSTNFISTGCIGQKWKNVKVVVTCRDGVLDLDLLKCFAPWVDGVRQDISTWYFHKLCLKEDLRGFVVAMTQDVEPSETRQKKVEWCIRTIDANKAIVATPFAVRMVVNLFDTYGKQDLKVDRRLLFEKFLDIRISYESERPNSPNAVVENRHISKPALWKYCEKLAKAMRITNGELRFKNMVGGGFSPLGIADDETLVELHRILTLPDANAMNIRSRLPVDFVDEGDFLSFKFEHASIYEFFLYKGGVALAGRVDDLVIELNWKPLWKQHRSVFDFWCDHAQQSREMREVLFALIGRFGQDPAHSVATSNAVGILNAAGTCFTSRDFSKIWLTDAYLAHGNFDSVNFSDAHLTRCNFNRAWLRGANLSRAVCTDISFGEYPSLIGHEAVPIHSLCVGKGVLFAANGCCIQVWDATTLECVQTLCGHRGTIRTLCFCPSRNLLISGGEDGTLRQWVPDPEAPGAPGAPGTAKPQGDWVQEGVIELPYSLRVLCLVASHSGHDLFGGLSNGTVCVWSLASLYQPYKQLPLPPPLPKQATSIVSLSICSQDRYLVIGESDSSISFWRLSNNEAIFIYSCRDAVELPSRRPHSPFFVEMRRACVCVSATRKLCFSSDSRPQIRVWDLVRLPPPVGQPKKVVLNNHREGITDMCLGGSNDDFLLSCSLDDNVCIWDLRGSHIQLVRVIFNKEASLVRGCVSLCASSDGKIVYAGGSAGTVWVTEAIVEAMPRTRHKAGVSCVLTSPDGSKVVSAGFDGVLRVWDIVTFQLLRQLRRQDTGVRSICFTTDGRFLVSSSSDGLQNKDGSKKPSNTAVLLWHAEDFNKAGAFHDVTDRVLCLCAAPNRKAAKSYVLTGDNACSLSVWCIPDDSLSQEQCVIARREQVLCGHACEIDSICWTASGYVASGSRDGVVCIWRWSESEALSCAKTLSTGELAMPVLGLCGLGGQFNDVLVSGCSDIHKRASGKVSFWKMSDASDEPFLTVAGEDFRCVCATDQYLFTGCGRYVYVWDFPKPESFGVFSPSSSPSSWRGQLSLKPMRALEGHSNDLKMMSVSPCGKHLMTASEDQSIRCWNIGQWTLCHRSSPVVLNASGVILDGCMGLTTLDRRLLLQRGDSMSSSFRLALDEIINPCALEATPELLRRLAEHCLRRLNGAAATTNQASRQDHDHELQTALAASWTALERGIGNEMFMYARAGVQSGGTANLSAGLEGMDLDLDSGGRDADKIVVGLLRDAAVRAYKTRIEHPVSRQDVVESMSCDKAALLDIKLEAKSNELTVLLRYYVDFNTIRGSGGAVRVRGFARLVLERIQLATGIPFIVLSKGVIKHVVVEEDEGRVMLRLVVDMSKHVVFSAVLCLAVGKNLDSVAGGVGTLESTLQEAPLVASVSSYPKEVELFRVVAEATGVLY